MNRGIIIKRLGAFGYDYDETNDSFSVDFCIEKVENHILNAINCSMIPSGLTNIAVDMACGEFLKLQKGFGKLTDFETIAQSIKLGDTNIQFPNSATPEQKFDAAVTYLLEGHEDDFTRYRKLVW